MNKFSLHPVAPLLKPGTDGHGGCSTTRGKNKVKLSTVNNDFLHSVVTLVGGCDRDQREQNCVQGFLTFYSHTGRRSSINNISSMHSSVCTSRRLESCRGSENK